MMSTRVLTQQVDTSSGGVLTSCDHHFISHAIEFAKNEFQLILDHILSCKIKICFHVLNCFVGEEKNGKQQQQQHQKQNKTKGKNKKQTKARKETRLTLTLIVAMRDDLHATAG